jgi:hypothetical protein
MVLALWRIIGPSGAPGSAASPARSPRESTRRGWPGSASPEWSVVFTYQVGDGLHSAIIKATKPTDAHSATAAIAAASRTTLPMASDSGCC